MKVERMMNPYTYTLTTNEHLEKAKRALDAAAELDVDLTDETLPLAYSRLLVLAEIQAKVAQAEATERLAEIVKNRAHG